MANSEADTGAFDPNEEALNHYSENLQNPDYKQLLKNSGPAKEILHAMLELRGKLESGEINAESYDHQLILAMMAREGRDHLATEVLNKKYFKDSLEKALDDHKRYGDNFALMILDLDNFKNINDSLGHAEGDDTIVRMGKILASSFRKGDVVGRYGGDEFTVLLKLPPEYKASMPLVAAQKLRYTLPSAAPSQARGSGINISVSSGIAIADKGDDEQSIFRRADAGLYMSKIAGKDSITVVTTENQQLDINSYMPRLTENVTISRLPQAAAPHRTL